MDEEREHVIPAVEGGHVILIGRGINLQPAAIHEESHRVFQAIIVHTDVLRQGFVGLGLVPVITDVTI